MGFQVNGLQVSSRLDSHAKPCYLRLSNELSIGYRKGKMVSRWEERLYAIQRSQIARQKGSHRERLTTSIPHRIPTVADYPLTQNNNWQSRRGSKPCPN